MNGAFGARQIQWLSSQLEDAAASGERLILLSHVVLHPNACHGTTMAWDYVAALDAIERGPPGVVAAVFCGHEHKGGYHHDPTTGVHHVTICSPLNQGSAGSAFGVVLAFADRLEVHSPRLDSLLMADDLVRAATSGGGGVSASASGGVLSLALPRRDGRTVA